MIKVFISGFPLDIQEIELVQLVSIYGEVSTIKIVRDKITGVCKGYGFLEMTSLEGANNAIESLNGNQMGKKSLFLNIVTQKEIKPENKTKSTPVLAPVTSGEGTFSKPKRPRIIPN